MIGAIMRSVGSVIAGLMVASILLIGVEGVSSILHPFPPGFDPNDMEACKAYPAGVLALAVLAWGLTVFVSSWVATQLGTGRHLPRGIVFGSLLLASIVGNMVMLPYPIWFGVNLFVFSMTCLAGA